MSCDGMWLASLFCCSYIFQCGWSDAKLFIDVCIRWYLPLSLAWFELSTSRSLVRVPAFLLLHCACLHCWKGLLKIASVSSWRGRLPVVVLLIIVSFSCRKGVAWACFCLYVLFLSHSSCCLRRLVASLSCCYVLPFGWYIYPSLLLAPNYKLSSFHILLHAIKL